MDNFCRNCGNKLTEDSQFCNKCGLKTNKNNNIVQDENEQTNNVDEKNKKLKKKDPNNVPAWLVILIVIFISLFVYEVTHGELDGFNSNENFEYETESESIEYQKVTVEELIAKLDLNAAAAKEEYNGKYLEITGKLMVIDSDLKYIGIYPIDSYRLIGVHCSLNDSIIKEKVKTLSVDQIITVRGKITDVGEILGYYLDAHEIL